MPVRSTAGGRTSKHFCRRHICFAPRVSWPRLSRDGRPQGSQPGFPWGDVARWLNPYPLDYRAALACSLILYPPPRGLALRLAVPCGRTTGLPRSADVQRVGKVATHPPVVRHLRREMLEPPDLTTHLLVQAFQHLWLVLG